MLDLGQFRTYIVRPSLERIGLWSHAAERLVAGTALTESRLVYLDQVESTAGDRRPGPAYGLYQMEGRTHDDIWQNYILKRTELQDALARLILRGIEPLDQLHGNLYYATAMCRIFYRRIPRALPDADDLDGMAQYWKRFYNTALGSGTAEGFKKKAAAIMSL